MSFFIARYLRKATAANIIPAFTLHGYQRFMYGAVEPSKALWRSVATDEAAKAGLDPEDVLDGYKGHRAARARWCAWRRILDDPEGYSAAGVGRVSGWSHTDVIYGMRRLAGETAQQIHPKKPKSKV